MTSIPDFFLKGQPAPTARVLDPDQQEWADLVEMVHYLNEHPEKVLDRFPDADLPQAIEYIDEMMAQIENGEMNGRLIMGDDL